MKHAGETALLVGNGENMLLTPPEWFGYPAFGMNTIHKYAGFNSEGWKPDYYTAVDTRVMREFGKDIEKKYQDVPKFVPTPNLDEWRGDNFYRFYFRPGPLWPHSQARMWPSGLLTEQGISYGNIMHVAMQLAFYMGFTTLLMIGVQHKEHKAQVHFWGTDHATAANPPYVADWLEGYKVLVKGMAEQGVTVLNISADTYVPNSVIPRDDWRVYAKSEIFTVLPGR